jgi:hypothetical protein
MTNIIVPHLGGLQCRNPSINRKGDCTGQGPLMWLKILQVPISTPDTYQLWLRYQEGVPLLD